MNFTTRVDYSKTPDEMLRDSNLYIDSVFRLPGGLFWAGKSYCSEEQPTGVHDIRCELMYAEGFMSIKEMNGVLKSKSFRRANTEELIACIAALPTKVDKYIIGTGGETWWCSFPADHPVVPMVCGKAFSIHPSQWEYKDCYFLGVKEISP